MYTRRTTHELPAYAYTPARCPESTGFRAECAEIPGLIAYGATPEEAVEEIKMAVCGWLEVLAEDGLPFPEPRQPQQQTSAGQNGRAGIRETIARTRPA